MLKYFNYKINSLLLSLLCSAPVMAAESFQELREFQIREVNNLLSKGKPKSLKIQNRSSLPTNLDTLYRQHLDEETEDDTLLGLLPPDDCSYVDTDSLDKFGFPNISKVHDSNAVFLTEAKGKSPRLSSAYLFLQQATVKAGETINVQEQPLSSISRIRLHSENLIPQMSLVDGVLKITLSDKATLSYPFLTLPLDFANLTSRVKTLPRTAKLFREQVLPGEGTSYSQFVKLMQDLYNKAIQSPFKLTPSRIPLLTHTIWANPATIADLFTGNNNEWLAQTIQSCPPLEGWQHLIWLPSQEDAKKAASLTPKFLRDKVSFKALLDLPSFNKSLFSKGLSPALISKIARFYILQEQGGVFRGTDIEIAHSLKALNGTYDLYCSLDSASASYPLTSLLAARAHHPVIQKAIIIIERNLSDTKKPGYLKAIEGNTNSQEALYDKTIFGYDAGPLATALLQDASNPDRKTVDVVFPPYIFNPMRSSADILNIDDNRQLWNPVTLAVNYNVRHWNVK